MPILVLLSAAGISVDLLIGRRLLIQRGQHRARMDWVGGVALVTLALVIGAPFVYVRVIEGHAPPPLSLSDLGSATGGATSSAAHTTTRSTAAPSASAAASPTATSTTVGPVGSEIPATHASPATQTVTAAVVAGGTSISGAWIVGGGSEAGYRIDETVMGQSTTVVGRTNEVTGALSIAGLTVNAAHFSVNMQSVTCHCVHDVAFHDTLLQTSQYPTATFTLTQPIVLSSVPPSGAVIHEQATGEFMIHGRTHLQTFGVAAELTNGRIGISADIPFKLSDYDISAPSGGGMGGVSDNGVMEVLLALDRGAT